MSKDENEFQKLLNEAPAVPDEDTVTMVGVLARTADAARFLLTLPNGRADTLDVAAVKSSRKVAGATRQPLVELVLDAKQVPENIRNILSGWYFNPTVSGSDPWAGTRAHKDVFEGTVAPFVAATPHQVDPETMDALAFSAGARTYLTAYVWTGDTHPVFKVRADPQF